MKPIKTKKIQLLEYTLARMFLGSELSAEKINNISQSYVLGKGRKLGKLMPAATQIPVINNIIRPEYSSGMQELKKKIQKLPKGKLDRNNCNSLAVLIRNKGEMDETETGKIYRSISQLLDLEKKSTGLLTLLYSILGIYFSTQTLSITSLFFFTKLNNFIVDELFYISPSQAEAAVSNTVEVKFQHPMPTPPVNYQSSKTMDYPWLLGIGLQAGLDIIMQSYGPLTMTYLSALCCRSLARQAVSQFESIRWVHQKSEEFPQLTAFIKKTLFEDGALLIGTFFGVNLFSGLQELVLQFLNQLKPIVIINQTSAGTNENLKSFDNVNLATPIQLTDGEKYILQNDRQCNGSKDFCKQTSLKVLRLFESDPKIKRDYSKQQVKKTYGILSQLWHTDHCTKTYPKPVCEEQFQLIGSAWSAFQRLMTT